MNSPNANAKDSEVIKKFMDRECGTSEALRLKSHLKSEADIGKISDYFQILKPLI